ncbi:hypothetical protein CLOM_g12657 [Closterium sp. NIES-68]|nr:hypothetical protein CLOM_g12657 [Closterium sp. NIES-68]GJP82753.1 hypothetical protein CLOP_g12995 [Closterium sp. NIES-67]
MLSLSRSAQRVLRGSGASLGTALQLTRSTVQRLVPTASYSSDQFGDLSGDRRGPYRRGDRDDQSGNKPAGGRSEPENQQRSFQRSPYDGQGYPQSNQYSRSDQHSSQYKPPGPYQRRGEQQRQPQQPPAPAQQQQYQQQQEGGDELETIEWQSELSNTVHLIGTIALDPVPRFLDSGKCVTNMRLAVGWKKANGEKRTDWYALQLWDDLAMCAQNVKKGARVYVSGRLHMEEYTDSSGAPRLEPKVDVKRIALVASNFGNSGSGRKSSQGGFDQGVYSQGGYNQGGYSPQPTAYAEPSNSSTSTQGRYDSQSYGNQSGYSSVSSYSGPGGNSALAEGEEELSVRDLPRVPRFDGKLNTEQVHALWDQFFKDPVQFFDYREFKRQGVISPKAPDFKKAATGEPLWVDARDPPYWLHASLELYDRELASAMAGLPVGGEGGEAGEEGGEQYGGGAMDARGF